MSKSNMDDSSREKLFDLIFKFGPMTPGKLKEQASEDGLELTVGEVKELTDHDWFTMQFGNIYIANIDGCRRRVTRTEYSCY